MKNLTWQNPEQLFVAQELINKVKSKCCGIKVEKNGILVGFSGYTYSLNGIRRPKDKPYLVNEFVNYDTIKIREMCDEIRRLKAAGADFVVSYVHIGTEYQKNPNVYQRKVADSLFHAGAHLILMSHPHILQKMSVLTSKDSLQKSLVAYSLGNFISSQVGTESTFKDIGAILEVEVKKWKDTTSISAVSVIPTYSYWRKDHIGVLPVIKAHDTPDKVIKLRKKDTVKINKAYYHTLEVLRGDMDSTLWKIEDERYRLEWK